MSTANERREEATVFFNSARDLSTLNPHRYHGVVGRCRTKEARGMSQVSQDMPFVVDIASKASDLIHPIDTHLGVVGRCCTKEKEE